jgi:hypothetical protein
MSSSLPPIINEIQQKYVSSKQTVNESLDRGSAYRKTYFLQINIVKRGNTFMLLVGFELVRRCERAWRLVDYLVGENLISHKK